MKQAEQPSAETEAAPEIAGRVTIEWPNAAECGPGPLTGTTVVRDAATGEPLRALTVTVTALPGGPVVADVTHPANDGRPLIGEADGYWDYPWVPGGVVGDRGQFPGEVAVRRYEVARMTEIPPVEPWTAKVNRAVLAVFFRQVTVDGGTVEALRLPVDDMRELAYGPGPFGGLGATTFTEEGVTRPERVASVRLASVENEATGGAKVMVSVAPEGEEASALVRYGPDGPVRAVAVTA